MAELSAPPLQTPLIEAPRPFITRVWNNWFLSVINRVQVAAYAVVNLALTDQGASISTTDAIPAAADGLYRVTYRFRVTQAASTSSSLAVTITTTDGGVTCSLSTTAYTGNVTNEPQSGTLLVRCDAGSPLTYATTYASVGGTPMLYRLDLLVERV